VRTTKHHILFMRQPHDGGVPVHDLALRSASALKQGFRAVGGGIPYHFAQEPLGIFLVKTDDGVLGGYREEIFGYVVQVVGVSLEHL